MDLQRQIFANRNRSKDFVYNAVIRLSSPACNINIAVAFFTQADILNELVERECAVKLLVRLGYPTCPRALEKALRMERVQVRYVTDRSFHPKLYVFGDRGVLVGSANFTRAAFFSNQEVMVCIGPADQRFEDLALLFADYWGQGKVMDSDVLAEYARVYRAHAELDRNVDRFDEDVERSLGRVVIANIERGLPRESVENIYLDEFKRSYQEFVDAFAVIRNVYEEDGRRETLEEGGFPLRLEIDSFLSYVREEHAKTNRWQEEPLRSGEDQRRFVRKHVQRWHEERWSYFHDVVVPKLYPSVQRVFASRDAVTAATDELLFEGLEVLHSFRERLRFFPGGLATLREVFFRENDGKKMRESLAYLLFGPGDIQVRMANLIFQPEFKLSQFGRANVQELVGWCNDQELPVVNGRTTKVFRFFGFQVQQL